MDRHQFPIRLRRPLSQETRQKPTKTKIHIPSPWADCRPYKEGAREWRWRNGSGRSGRSGRSGGLWRLMGNSGDMHDMCRGRRRKKVGRGGKRCSGCTSTVRRITDLSCTVQVRVTRTEQGTFDAMQCALSCRDQRLGRTPTTRQLQLHVLHPPAHSKGMRRISCRRQRGLPRHVTKNLQDNQHGCNKHLPPDHGAPTAAATATESLPCMFRLGRLHIPREGQYRK